MAILGFCVGALLVVCGFGSLASSVNLVPTEMGMLYALSGVILIGCGGISLGVAALIARIDRIVAPRPRARRARRRGDLRPPRPPSARARERGRRRGQPQPQRPSAEPARRRGGARRARGAAGDRRPLRRGRRQYLIFSDGTIEAETEDGGYRFGSMDEFKAYLAGRKL